MLQRVTTAVEIARQEWADGHRRLEAEREHAVRYRLLHAQVDAITEQLRRRLGSVFTLGELAAEYGRAEGWAQGAVAELDPAERWLPGLATATDAAFHLYARGAQDYKP
jgi:hypothetical protein